jgi:hypothetical protein
MVGSKEEVLLKEDKWPDATPAVIPPPIVLRLTHSSLCFVFFMFLCRLLSGKPRGPFK